MPGISSAPERVIDTVTVPVPGTVSAIRSPRDGQRLAGRQRYGTPFDGRRLACPHTQREIALDVEARRMGEPHLDLLNADFARRKRQVGRWHAGRPQA